MAGIAMAGWCEGTERRLAPDRGRTRRMREKAGREGPKIAQSLTLLQSGFMPCDRLFLTCMEAAGLWHFTVFAKAVGLRKPTTQVVNWSEGLEEAIQGESIRYFPYTFYFDNMLFVLFWNSPEGLGDLNSSSWTEWEERDYWKREWSDRKLFQC